jgi:hypothetical protein
MVETTDTIEVTPDGCGAVMPWCRLAGVPLGVSGWRRALGPHGAVRILDMDEREKAAALAGVRRSAKALTTARARFEEAVRAADAKGASLRQIAGETGGMLTYESIRNLLKR